MLFVGLKGQSRLVSRTISQPHAILFKTNRLVIQTSDCIKGSCCCDAIVFLFFLTQRIIVVTILFQRTSTTMRWTVGMSATTPSLVLRLSMVSSPTRLLRPQRRCQWKRTGPTIAHSWITGNIMQTVCITKLRDFLLNLTVTHKINQKVRLFSFVF